MLIRKSSMAYGGGNFSASMLLGLSAFMLTACAPSGSIKKQVPERGDELLGYGGALFMPSLKDIQSRDEYVVGMRVKVDCVGISGISGLPDGWEIASTVKGESVALSMKLEEVWLYDTGSPELKQMQSEVAKIRINLLYRGQWSDCMSWKLELDTVSKSDMAMAKKSYEPMPFKTYRYEDCSLDHHDWCLIPDEAKK